MTLNISSFDKLFLLSEYPQNSEMFKIGSEDKSIEIVIYENGVMRDAIRFALPKHPDYRYHIDLEGGRPANLTFEESKDFEVRHSRGMSYQDAYDSMIAWHKEREALLAAEPTIDIPIEECPDDCQCHQVTGEGIIEDKEYKRTLYNLTNKTDLTEEEWDKRERGYLDLSKSERDLTEEEWDARERGFLQGYEKY